VKDYGVDDVIAAIERIHSSSFLKGQNKNGWIITFDWFLKPNNFIKVSEGNYDETKASTSGRRSAMDDLMEIHEMFAEAENND